MWVAPISFSLPYEYSGLLAISIFGIFLCIYNCAMFNCQFIILIIVILLGLYVMDGVACRNIEYGYRKLAIRGFSGMFCMVLLISNYYLNLFPANQLFCLWYIVGYLVTSCIFQFLLIHKYLPIQNNNNTTTTIEISQPETKL